MDIEKIKSLKFEAEKKILKAITALEAQTLQMISEIYFNPTIIKEVYIETSELPVEVGREPATVELKATF